MQQPEQGASAAPKVSKGFVLTYAITMKELGIIKWNEQTTNKIWNIWRALSDTFGVTTYFKPPPLDKTHKEQPVVKIFLTKMIQPGPSVLPEVAASQPNAFKPGMIFYDKKQVFFSTSLQDI